MKVLIANRGEVAKRIASTCHGMEVPCVVTIAPDDVHAGLSSVASALVSSYTSVEAVVQAAREAGASHVHPGYGFLSERGDFARALSLEAIEFVGPCAEVLDLFGSKVAAKRFARECGTPVTRDSEGACETMEAAGLAWERMGACEVVVKSVDGGGGRGIRRASSRQELEAAYLSCQREARASGASGRVFLEQYIPYARHIEIQFIGDALGNIAHLGDRECSLQRKNQKIIEVAPSPSISLSLRAKLIKAALTLATRCKFTSLGTAEFLVPLAPSSHEPDFYFLEINPRLQVEHTVTEQVYGLDLVALQLHVAGGADLRAHLPACAFVASCVHAGRCLSRGFALQVRVCAERMSVQEREVVVGPCVGTVTRFEAPLGRSVRVDTAVRVGMRLEARYDSLLAKVIVWGTNWPAAVDATRRAMREFVLEGVETNAGLIRALLGIDQVRAELFGVDTGFVERMLIESKLEVEKVLPEQMTASTASFTSPSMRELVPQGCIAVVAPVLGTIESWSVQETGSVSKGQEIGIITSMKMEYVVRSPISGRIVKLLVAKTRTVSQDDPIAFIQPMDTQFEISGFKEDQEQGADLTSIRPDLQELRDRLTLTLDASRPAAISKLKSKHPQRLTAREKIALFSDTPDAFFEYGALVLAAQRSRRAMDDLRRDTPADSVITGFTRTRLTSRSAVPTPLAVVAYDTTVLAGTQGHFGHKKLDRIFEVALQRRSALVLFCEGGGGRPGDVDAEGVVPAGLDLSTWTLLGKIGRVAPVVGVVAGYCFAGNAALLMACDIVVATENSNIGMGGPSMIEGGGLGNFKVEEIGPAAMHARTGGVDILVKSDEEAVQVAKQILSYFCKDKQRTWEAPDQAILRHVIPEYRRRVYDVRKVVHTLADTDSILELQAYHAPSLLTFLARIAGRPVAIIANNARVNGGAIDGASAAKMTRFLRVSELRGVPVVTLCDTPGFMVGPRAEEDGQGRRFGELFRVAAGLSVPVFTVILRKAVGLGAMAMALGSFRASSFTISWPTGEAAGMGVEASVRLGLTKELAEIKDPEERQIFFDSAVAQVYERGKAVNYASFSEIDAVIDPVETRKWLEYGLESTKREAKL
ncbi:carbamoyl-phosphate synthase L chain ATP-binding protein [Chytriomyces sp. MP71]|nr:carbamoyl-phosphate synthase L chain ATP-binding protein [Chytriomyces sp. MP71]